MTEYYTYGGNKIILHDFDGEKYVGVTVHKGEFFTHSEQAGANGDYGEDLPLIVAALERALSSRGASEEKVNSPTPFFDTDRAIITDDGELYAVGVRNGKFGASKRHPEYITTPDDLKENLDKKMSEY